MPCSCSGSCPCLWFKFVPPGVAPNPTINPLSYVQFLGVPPFTTGGSGSLAYIYTCSQITGAGIKPVIDATLTTTINTAILTVTSACNVYIV
ncbi:hypothetical protein SAMN05518672_1015 [Chitinophaga sp. CF118]|nr:hypothetical protein SAMN05518672_1015 [Chitinophaga sp. CF118]